MGLPGCAMLRLLRRENPKGKFVEVRDSNYPDNVVERAIELSNGRLRGDDWLQFISGTGMI